MAAPRHVAVIDVGKTNAKVSLVGLGDRAELALRTVPNAVRSDGPYPHFDVASVWDFLLGALADLNREAEIDAIAIATHGACGAFINGDSNGDGLALPILDYEFAGPDELKAEYDQARPQFDETLSPRLPIGLNLGAQIFWQERRHKDAFESAATYLTYPQYWAWRLTGVAAMEMSSVGCHTDLWNPRERTWSSMVVRAGWGQKFAPLRSAFDVLGPLRPALASRLGLKPSTAIHCGIHDSSAALLPHVIARKPPFTVVSTGTWTIVLAVGGSIDRLDPKRDTLAYVTPFGDTVPAARFMGGREFERLVGPATTAASEAEIMRVIDSGVMVLPTFAPGVGPFPDAKGRWTHMADALSPSERFAAASFYLALMTTESMSCAGAGGPTIIEGPFAGNQIFCAALAAITGRSVHPSAGTGGTSRGASFLVDPERKVPEVEEKTVAPLSAPNLPRYMREWRERARK